MISKIFRRYWLEPRQRRMHRKCSASWMQQLNMDIQDPLVCRQNALHWLTLAQANPSHPGFGFDRAFNLSSNQWELPYPETTGYIIPTLLANAPFFPALNLKEKAISAGHWLRYTQFESGAICAKQWFEGNDVPSVFNTGMVLHGFAALATETGMEEFKEAAKNAADWLGEVQHHNGAWHRHSFNGIEHTYYTMVAWGLVIHGISSSDQSALRTAKKHLDWVLKHQASNGWMEKVGFYAEPKATTHTIAYCAQGLAESGRLLNDEQYIQAAIRMMEPMNQAFHQKGFLPGEFDSDWNPIEMCHKDGFNRTKLDGHWECLTGSAQASCTNFSLSLSTGNSLYKEVGSQMNAHLRSRQMRLENNQNVHGAISGSWPLHGPYDTLCLPNHAAKFFIDALTMEDVQSK